MPTSPLRAASALPLQRILVFAIAYVLAWTVLPAYLGHSFALDVAESLSWGKEWPLGTYKHPTLGPIVLNQFYELFGKFGPYLLSQLCIALTLWMVWLTGRRLMSAQRALLGTVLTMGVTYYNFPAIEFNHNIAQMPIWAALGYSFVAALQDGKLKNWVLLGVLAGLGMFTKYSIAVLLLSFGLYVLCSPKRKLLLTPGPWLSIVLMVLIFAPHLQWLYAFDWLPFAYASERSLAHDGNPRLEALQFPLTQLAAHLPLLLILGFAWWRTRGVAASTTDSAPVARWHTHSPQLLLAIALLPALIVVLLGIITGARLRDMWGSPMWAFSGLLIVSLLPNHRLQLMQPKLLRGTALWLVLVTCFMAVYMTWGAQLRKRPARVDWPSASIAQQADSAWSRHTHCRLDVVAGDYWLAGLVSAYGATRPSVLINGNPQYSPWADTQRLRQHGTLWVWQEKPGEAPPQPPQPLASLISEGVFTQYDSISEVPWPHLPKYPALKLHWQVYLPTNCVQ